MTKCAWGYTNDARRCTNDADPIMCKAHNFILEELDTLEYLHDNELISDEEYDKRWTRIVTRSEIIA